MAVKFTLNVFFLNSPITWATPTNYLTKLLIEKSSHQSMKSHLNRVLLWTCFHTSLSFIKARFPFGCFITFQLWRWNVGNQIPVIQSPGHEYPTCKCGNVKSHYHDGSILLSHGEKSRMSKSLTLQNKDASGMRLRPLRRFASSRRVCSHHPHVNHNLIPERGTLM